MVLASLLIYLYTIYEENKPLDRARYEGLPCQKGKEPQLQIQPSNQRCQVELQEKTLIEFAIVVVCLVDTYAKRECDG